MHARALATQKENVALQQRTLYIFRGVLFFCRFDVRGKSVYRYASHYTDDNVFGHRAKMRVPTLPSGSATTSGNSYQPPDDGYAVLVVESIRRSDAGVYKCRADFKKSPTKNSRFILSVQGKTNILQTMVSLRPENSII